MIPCFPVRICAFREIKPSYKSILIKNVSKEITPRIFYEKLSEFGEIYSAKLAINNETGESKKYGYLSFENESSIDNCIKNIKSIFDSNTEAILIENREKGSALYTKNLPLTYSEDEIKDFFSKYGSVKLVKKLLTNNEYRGACIITYDDYRSTYAAIIDIKANEYFLSKKQLFANYLQKKEDKIIKETSLPRHLIFAKLNLCYLNKKTYSNEDEIKNDIVLDLKMIFLEDYTPTNILIDLNQVTAVIELSKPIDIERFKEGLINVIEKMTFNYQQINQENISLICNILNTKQYEIISKIFNLKNKSNNLEGLNVNSNLPTNNLNMNNYNTNGFNNIQNSYLNNTNNNSNYNNNQEDYNKVNTEHADIYNDNFNYKLYNNNGSKLIPGLSNDSYFEKQNNLTNPNMYNNQNYGINYSNNQFNNYGNLGNYRNPYNSNFMGNQNFYNQYYQNQRNNFGNNQYNQLYNSMNNMNYQFSQMNLNSKNQNENYNYNMFNNNQGLNMNYQVSPNDLNY